MRFLKTAEVEAQRGSHEPEELWEWRRDFMMLFREDMPRDELVTLAQVYTNIHVLGCTYPPATLKKVADLAKKLSPEYKESRRNKMKHAFLKAKAAAERKTKPAPEQ